jgi:hypothetical protein
MADLTIANFQVDEWDSALAFVRFISEQGWVDSAGHEHIAESYRQFTLTVDSGARTASLASIAYLTTGDAIVNQRATIRVEVCDNARWNKPEILVEGLSIIEAFAPLCEWAELKLYGSAQNPYRDASGYTRSETIREINMRVRSGAVATETDLGLVELATTPVDPLRPRVVLTEDDRLPSQAENDAMVGTSGSPSSSNPYVTDADSRVNIFVDPRHPDYGAVCDGIADDTLAYEAAMAARNAVGGVLIIPPGQSLIGGPTLANKILQMTSSGGIVGFGARSELLIMSGTPITTDLIRVNPPNGSIPTAEPLARTPNNEGGYFFRDFAVRAQTPGEGRDAIRVETTGTGSVFFNGLFENLQFGHLGGHSISLLNTGANADGGIVSTTVRHNWLQDGISAVSVGDSNRFLYNNFRGTNRGLDISFVTGAGDMQFVGNNMTADGGVKISGGVGLNIHGNFMELYKAGAAGSSGAVLEITGGALDVSVNSNLFGSLAGNTLNGVRVDVATMVRVEGNYFAIPAGKFAAVFTSGAINPVFGGFQTVIGGGAGLSNSSTSALTTIYGASNGASTRIGSMTASSLGMTPLFTGHNGLDNATLEINRNAATSVDAQWSEIRLVTNQSGTANVVGVLYFGNPAIAAADKRLATILALTEGATNQGALAFYTNNAGSVAERMRVTHDGAIELPEMSDPSAPAANKARLYVRDNGSGKTQIVVRFPSGSVQVIATEP